MKTVESQPPAAIDSLKSIMLPCAECGYDLRATTGERCPECGWVIDHEGLSKSQLPWGVRASIGRVRAYVQTVWLATAQPRKLAMETSHPVDFAAARRFAFITSILIAIPFVAITTYLIWAHGTHYLVGMATSPLTFAAAMVRNPRLPGLIADFTLPWVAGVVIPGVAQMSIVVATVLLPGWASYWFHPGTLPVTRQNRAVAVSYYISAPFIWSAVGVAVLFLESKFSEVLKWKIPFSLRDTLSNILVIAGMTLLFGGILVAGIGTLVLMMRTTQASVARVLLASVLLPMSWLIGTVITLFVLPWVVGLIAILVNSVR